MKLTVISAAYNVLSSVGLERMERSIRSVAAIPIEHEHLIYDGASTDGTVEALRRLEAEIPTLKVVSEKDSGLYEALNKGLRAANGDYFYVLGLDDIIIHPEHLAEMTKDASIGNYDMYVAQVVVENARHPFPKQLGNAAGEFARPSYGHQGVIVRTALARSDRIGAFDAKYKIAADYKQLLLCHWNDAKVGRSKKVVAAFADSGVSSRSKELSIEEAHQVKKEVYDLSEKEFVKMKATGSIPLRVAIHYLGSTSSFSKYMGFKALWSYVFRKHKKLLDRAYYLFGIPIINRKY